MRIPALLLVLGVAAGACSSPPPPAEPAITAGPGQVLEKFVLNKVP